MLYYIYTYTCKRKTNENTLNVPIYLLFIIWKVKTSFMAPFVLKAFSGIFLFSIWTISFRFSSFSSGVLCKVSHTSFFIYQSGHCLSSITLTYCRRPKKNSK